LPRVVGILSPDLARGFALAGVDVTSYTDTRGGQQALTTAVESLGYGLVIVEQRLLDSLDPRTREAIYARNIPLVIAVPGELRWEQPDAGATDDYVAALIRRAVGYQLNITF
jgi:vacuolar-type H+-ATPase subunit F/Vma7